MSPALRSPIPRVLASARALRREPGGFGCGASILVRLGGGAPGTVGRAGDGEDEGKAGDQDHPENSEKQQPTDSTAPTTNGLEDGLAERQEVTQKEVWLPGSGRAIPGRPAIVALRM